MIRTLIQTYHSEREMRREVAKHEKRGFAVQSISRNGQGYSFLKTATLADRKSTRLNSSHMSESRMPSSA